MDKERTAQIFLDAQQMEVKAVFLDRDGTIIEDVHYLSRLEDIKLMPLAKEGLALLKECGYKLIVVTNQSGIGRGYFSEEFVKKTHDVLNGMLDNMIDAFYFCPHKPEDNCSCRKPKPGMIEQAIGDFGIDRSKSYVVGDKETDVELGLNAGITPLLVINKDNAHLLENTKARAFFSNIYEVAMWICRRDFMA